MREYLVKFWYATDLRYEINLKARTEAEALILALSDIKEEDGWATEKPFRIEIEIA